MKCSNCNFENELGATVCASCGANLNIVSQTANEITEKPKKGNNLVKIIPIIIVLILLAGGLGFYLLSSNPLNVYKASVKKLGNQIIEKSEDKKSYYKVDLKPEITSSGEKDLEKLVNKVSVSVSGNVNQDAKKMVLGVSTKYDNKDLLSADIQYQDSSAYLFLNNILNKPIKVDAEEIDSDKMNKKTTEILVNSSVNAINKSLKKTYFTKDKETVSVSGKEVKVNAYKLKLNNKNYREINESISKTLLEDREFVTALAKLTDSKEKEVKESIKESFKSDVFYDKTTFIIYTSGLFNKYVGFKVDADDTGVSVIKNSDGNYTITTQVSKLTVKVDVNVEVSNNNDKLKDVKDAINAEELSNSDLTSALDNVKKLDGYSSLKEDVKNVYDVNLDDLIDYLKMMMSYSNGLDL